MILFKLYLKIKLRSNYRVFKKNPLSVRCLVFILFLLLIYVLAISEIEVSYKSFFYCLGVFIFIGKWLCKISDKEKTLMKILNIPIAPIIFVKCSVLAIFVCMLNPIIGVLVLSTGSFIVYFFSTYKISFFKFTIPSFFLPQAYQWVSTWRLVSIYLYVFGIFLMTMGLLYENNGLFNVAIVWTISMPCFSAYFNDIDPYSFITIYKSPPILIYSKIKEVFINSLRLASIPIILLLLFSPFNLLPYLLILIGLLFNYFILFTYYCSYPNLIQAGVFLIIIIVVIPITYSIMPGIYAILVNIVLLLILCSFAYYNLKSILYVNTISGDRTTKI